jgi:RimJ/RimL family protein N-acetyltransferase
MRWRRYLHPMTAAGELPTVADLRARLVGRLVVVEPLAADHEAGLSEAARDGVLFDWLPEDLGASRQPLRDWLQWSLEAADSGRDVPFAILTAQCGNVVGSTRFQEIRLEHLRVEIGWTWLAKSVWGTGINVETKLLLLTHAFERVGCRRVEFKTDARNERSRGALEALGARFEGVFRKHMVVQQGAERDSAYYSVIDDEWPAVKATLERRLMHLSCPPISGSGSVGAPVGFGGERERQVR